MAIGAAVVLLGLHLVHDHLGALKILHNFSLHGDAIKVWLANLELAVVLERQHTAKLDLATWLRLKEKCRKALSESKCFQLQIHACR